MCSRVGGLDKGLLATKPVPSLATTSSTTLSSPLAQWSFIVLAAGDNGGFGGGQMLQDEKGYICQIQLQLLHKWLWDNFWLWRLALALFQRSLNVKKSSLLNLAPPLTESWAIYTLDFVLLAD